MLGASRRDAERTLQTVFHQAHFRPGQWETIHAMLEGRDVVALLPTGAGKSLCFQLPAVMRGGTTVVISPLVALMRDQSEHLAALQIPHAALYSGLSAGEITARTELIRHGEARLVYVSPERLMQPGFQALLCEVSPHTVVVDEAHCIVRWGDSFRPEYAQIGTWINSLPTRPAVCAVTATADPAMRREIEASLGMRHPRRVTLPVTRENLRYRVHLTLHPDEAMLAALKGHAGEKAVIVCATRADAEQSAKRLIAAGLRATSYHAGMDNQAREEAMKAFASGKIDVLASTVAFGMGVDIPDIRCVIHRGLPNSVADYAQETGRAGRNGLPSDCVLLIDPTTMRLRHLNLSRMPRGTAGERKRARQAAAQMHHMAELAFSGQCISAGIAHAFGQRSKPCGQCSACLNGQHGRLAPKIGLDKISHEGLNLWWAKVIRQHEAEKRGIAPERLMDNASLLRAVRYGHLNADSVPDAALRAQLTWLMRHGKEQS